VGVVRKNQLKQKLQANEPVIGVFLPVPSPQIVELSAVAGFDFVLIDNEHGPLAAETAYAMVLAAEASGITPIARVGNRDKQEVLKYLDIGVQGIMSPQIHTAEAAEDAVASTKYVPRGTRGMAGGRTFGYGVGIAPSEAAKRINEEMLTLIQFEHIDALDELEKIVQTPDLDVLFVGPNDLAQSMGFPGEPNRDEVTKIGDQAVAIAKAAGVKTGTTAFTPQATHAALARGFDMVVANAPGLYLQAAQTIVRETFPDRA
jgi:4-hydroxy-2-oxoheptanedioate aldolase